MTRTELRAWREAHGLTRREFAAIVGRSVRTVEHWENRAGPPSWLPALLAAHDRGREPGEVRVGQPIRAGGRRYIVRRIEADEHAAHIEAARR